MKFLDKYQAVLLFIGNSCLQFNILAIYLIYNLQQKTFIKYFK